MDLSNVWCHFLNICSRKCVTRDLKVLVTELIVGFAFPPPTPGTAAQYLLFVLLKLQISQKLICILGYKNVNRQLLTES